MKLTDALEGYLIASQAENKSKKTLAVIRWHITKFAAWLSSPSSSRPEGREDGHVPQLDDVTPQQFRAFLQSESARGLRPHSVHVHYRTIATFLRWCQREDLLRHDPLKNVSPPKLPQLLPKILSLEQVEALLKYLRKQTYPTGRRNYLMVLTFLAGGLRANELCQLKLEDLLLESQFLIVRSGKGGKQRVVPLRPILSKQLWRYVRQWREDFHPSCENVFVSKTGLPLKAENVERLCRRVLSQLGIRGGTHILRHTFATLCIQSRLYDLERLRLILGHADLSTTQRYLHLSQTDLSGNSNDPTPLARLGL